MNNILKKIVGKFKNPKLEDDSGTYAICQQIYDESELDILELVNFTSSCGTGSNNTIGGNFLFPESRIAEITGMYLFLQLDFSKLDHPLLPTCGLLQIFFANQNDDLGLSSRKVFFHPTTTNFVVVNNRIPRVLGNSQFLKRPFTFDAVKATQHVTNGDIRFESFASKYYNEENRVDIYDQYIDLNEADNWHNIKYNNMLGYSSHAQDNPLTFTEDGESYILLFQTLGVKIDDFDHLVIGDDGILNIFIKPDDLANAKFDNILFNWDCY